ncbi:MAG: Cof-type HAD-IIB family hydrolase [Bacteroidetes bacterium]|nr:Cof-type HAD-IIB family hydrolase [Bacteroidota bacterium]
MTFKAICSDIDGTLLNSERSLSPNLISIVSSISPEIPFFLASARMPAAMRYLLQDLKRPKEPLIAYNGALILDGEGKELESITIPIHQVEEVVNLANNLTLHVSLLNGEEWHTPKEDYFALREIENTKVIPSWIDPLVVIERWKSDNHGAHKVMCMGDPAKIGELYQTLLQRLGTQLHLYRSKDTYLEIAPKPISKATGLKKILDQGYAIGMDEVVAFGDGYNDIDLLEQVGWGVAVANALAEVKAVAQELTLHHKKDGVAVSLERIFLDKK